MGICFEGNTLKDTLKERDQLLQATRHFNGLKELPLHDKDPITFARFTLRLFNACINARETAKWMSGSPTLRSFGECVWLLALPEGDVFACSLGLAGHVGSIPGTIRAIIEAGYEDNPGIKDGDIFFNNHTAFGAPHNTDCYNLVPVFHNGELVAWSVGLNHIIEAGQAMGSSDFVASPWSFTDGFSIPPIKTGENFTTFRWWNQMWTYLTRAGLINILDDKARVSGAIVLRNAALEIIKEFGLDYFRRGSREILEHQRRVFEHAIRSQTVPGLYKSAFFQEIPLEGQLGPWCAVGEKRWIVHLPVELKILPDARLVVDSSGASSEGFHAQHGGEGQVRMGIYWWLIPQVLRSTEITTAPMYQIEVINPKGSIHNPKSIFVGRAGGTVTGMRYQGTLCNLFSRALYSRGVVEETFQGEYSAAVALMGGILNSGDVWGVIDFTFGGCSAIGARAYRDGESFIACHVNPQSDAGEVEEWDLYHLPFTTIGRGTQRDYVPHGKYRGAAGMYLIYLIVEPGQLTKLGSFYAIGAGLMGTAAGLCGGYPGSGGYTLILRNTNMNEVIKRGEAPTSPQEVWEWLEKGKLTAEDKILYMSQFPPSIRVQNNDLVVTVAHDSGAWGDPLERDWVLIEKDLNEGVISSDTAKKVYGGIGEFLDGSWKIDEERSKEAREKLKLMRREKAVSTKEWWLSERRRVINKEFSPLIWEIHKDQLKWEKTKSAFLNFWQLPGSYQL